MKKSVKISIIAVGSVIGLLLIIAAVFFIRVKLETSKMSALDTKEVIPGVFAVKDKFVDMYIVKNKDSYIAIDSGNTPEAVKEELAKLNIDPAKVKAVFLTHSDGDHAGGLKAFPNAKIYLSKDEEQMINGTTARMFIVHNKPIEKYETFFDNAIIDLDGMIVRAVIIPGHTPGSTVYQINTELVFTGDSIGLRDGKAGFFSKVFNMDTPLQERYIKKLARIDGKYIFTAHHGYSDNFAAAMGDY